LQMGIDFRPSHRATFGSIVADQNTEKQLEA
jgi:hypothetical protein